MESLDSGHATVKTDNSQPGLNQGQDPSSRVLLRSTRVATLARRGGVAEDRVIDADRRLFRR